jgi:hypothetical protein
MVLKGTERLNVSRNPVIKYKGQSIQRVRCFKYLGVLLDDKLFFSNHIREVAANAASYMHKLRRIARGEWGLSSGSLATIYKGVFESMVSYAAAVWHHRLDSNGTYIQNLRSEQRRSLLVCVGSYKTSSYEGTTVLGKALPADKLVKVRAAMYFLRKAGRVEMFGNTLEVAPPGETGARLGMEAPFQNLNANIIKLPLGQLKKRLYSLALDEWQCEWDASTRGRPVYNFIPVLKHWYASKVWFTAPVWPW